jgi:glycosyltransferase involved in cell wall biosynthesis
MASVIFPFLGSGVGGSHISSFTLAQSLAADFGVTSVVLCPGGTRIEEEAARRGLNVVQTRSRTADRHNPLYDLLQLAPRLSLLQSARGSASVVHCQDIGALQSFGPPAKLLGLPVVYHHRSINRPVLPNKMALSFADVCVAISESTRQNLYFIPQHKVVKVLNPFAVQSVDHDEARRAMLAAAGAPDEAVLFGFVGNFWANKRPLFFLEIARIVARSAPHAHFLLFGRDGDTTAEGLAARAEEFGIGENTHFMGFRSPPEANLAALDVLIAPALKEPFGRTLVEAMLLGTPYVATDDAGHSEIASRWGGGELAPPEASAEAVAAIALEILSGARKPALAPQRRAEVAAELSARKHAEAMLEIYRRVAPGFALTR